MGLFKIQDVDPSTLPCGRIHTIGSLAFVNGRTLEVVFAAESCSYLVGGDIVRKELLDDYEAVVQPKKDWLMSDYPKWLYIAQKSNIQFDSAITGVYRQLTESASHSNDVEKQIRFSLNAHSIRTYFAKKYNVKHLLPIIHKNEFNDLCKIAVRSNKNLFHTLWDFSAKNKIINFKIILKTVMFSTKIGRRYHINKYTTK